MCPLGLRIIKLKLKSKVPATNYGVKNEGLFKCFIYCVAFAHRGSMQKRTVQCIMCWRNQRSIEEVNILLRDRTEQFQWKIWRKRKLVECVNELKFSKFIRLSFAEFVFVHKGKCTYDKKCSDYAESQICAIPEPGANGFPRTFKNFCELNKFNCDNPNNGKSLTKILRFSFEITATINCVDATKFVSGRWRVAACFVSLSTTLIYFYRILVLPWWQLQWPKRPNSFKGWVWVFGLYESLLEASMRIFEWSGVGTTGYILKLLLDEKIQLCNPWCP